MVRFLYTGSQESMGEQIDPERSLGGFASKSIIPNKKNNLFPDISYLTIFNESEDYRAIIMENFSGSDLVDFKLGYRYDKDQYDIQVAVVELNEDGKMEIVGNSKTAPYYAEFFDLSVSDDQDNSLEIPTFLNNKKLS